MKISIIEDNERLAEEAMETCYNTLVKENTELGVLSEDITAVADGIKITLELEEIK